ncbi:hypothetical protein LOTGIDRAFT_166921 [Lottia gigantea]|uniref:Ig-like domain-containing protein n=1 Tax=Lottia gigantea TaxID=225164 RepID=V4BDI3_LOTGI|nr:hypothetical protein LOTGIDRAFT_166921 [Lottia gigantea]ESO86649.1 hypothetical protein LOTGIDRAFT_166921 [Lottia gigantea]
MLERKTFILLLLTYEYILLISPAASNQTQTIGLIETESKHCQYHRSYSFVNGTIHVSLIPWNCESKQQVIPLTNKTNKLLSKTLSKPFNIKPHKTNLKHILPPLLPFQKQRKLKPKNLGVNLPPSLPYQKKRNVKPQALGGNLPPLVSSQNPRNLDPKSFGGNLPPPLPSQKQKNLKTKNLGANLPPLLPSQNQRNLKPKDLEGNLPHPLPSQKQIYLKPKNLEGNLSPPLPIQNQKNLKPKNLGGNLKPLLPIQKQGKLKPKNLGGNLKPLLPSQKQRNLKTKNFGGNLPPVLPFQKQRKLKPKNFGVNLPPLLPSQNKSYLKPKDLGAHFPHPLLSQKQIKLKHKNLEGNLPPLYMKPKNLEGNLPPSLQIQNKKKLKPKNLGGNLKPLLPIQKKGNLKTKNLGGNLPPLLPSQKQRNLKTKNLPPLLQSKNQKNTMLNPDGNVKLQLKNLQTLKNKIIKDLEWIPDVPKAKWPSKIIITSKEDINNKKEQGRIPSTSMPYSTIKPNRNNTTRQIKVPDVPKKKLSPKIITSKEKVHNKKERGRIPSKLVPYPTIKPNRNNTTRQIKVPDVPKKKLSPKIITSKEKGHNKKERGRIPSKSMLYPTIKPNNNTTSTNASISYIVNEQIKVPDVPKKKLPTKIITSKENVHNKKERGRIPSKLVPYSTIKPNNNTTSTNASISYIVNEQIKVPDVPKKKLPTKIITSKENVHNKKERGRIPSKLVPYSTIKPNNNTTFTNSSVTYIVKQTKVPDVPKKKWPPKIIINSKEMVDDKKERGIIKSKLVPYPTIKPDHNTTTTNTSVSQIVHNRIKREGHRVKRFFDFKQVKKVTNFLKLTKTDYKKLFKKYYECLEKRESEVRSGSNEAITPKMILAGQPLHIPCGICKRPDQNAESLGVKWLVIRSGDGRMKRIRFNGNGKTKKKRIKFNKDYSLHIDKARFRDAGQYFCMVQDDFISVTQIDILVNERKRILYESNEKDVPLPTYYMENENIQIATVWAEWSSCDKCGDQGSQRKRGTCMVQKIYPDRPVKPKSFQMINKYPQGIPCHSSALPGFLKKKPEIKGRACEIYVRECYEACPSSPGPITITDKAGNVVEFIEPGYYSLKHPPTIPPMTQHRVIYEELGKHLVLKCPRLSIFANFCGTRKVAIAVKV